MAWLGVFSPITAQDQKDKLLKWVGKQPTYDKSFGNFFKEPEISGAIKRLISKRDLLFLASSHTKEAPIGTADGFLQIFVCGSKASVGCDPEILLVVKLKDRSMYAAFHSSDQKTRYYSTTGKFTDLPKKLQLPPTNFKK